ncbi:MAG: GAF domain-containing protein [Bacteroidaceae bacterium]
MAEELVLAGGSKAERYAVLLPQIEAVIQGEMDMIANMANVASMLWETFAPSSFPPRTAEQQTPSETLSWMWVGFYRVVDRELVLGPYQGPLACTRIGYGRGVCGKAWAEGHTIIVPDVNCFPDHIACSSASQSEIVVPLCLNSGHVFAILDIDSSQTHTFDDIDREWLERIVKLIQPNPHYR